MKYLLFIPLFFIEASQSKKFEIHRCILANGTVSFQEEKCSIDAYNRKPRSPVKAPIKKKKTVAAHKKQKPSLTKYQPAESEALYAKAGRYHITINVPKQWQYLKKVYSNKLYHIKMHNNQASSKASLMIDFIFPDNKKFSQEELDYLVHLLGSRFVKKSKESQVNIQKFNMNDGIGSITTFTSTEYMPKYRYTTKGALFKNKWLIQFTLLSNNLQDSSHHNAIYSLSQTIKIE